MISDDEKELHLYRTRAWLAETERDEASAELDAAERALGKMTRERDAAVNEAVTLRKRLDAALRLLSEQEDP